MNCDEEALTEYLDGELSAERRAAVEAHLGSCAGCSRTLDSLKSASKAFKEHAGAPPAAGLADAVRRASAPGRESKGRELAPVLTAAIVAVIVLLSVGTMFKPQISGIYNQVMGMISGAASTVGSGN